MSAFAALGRFVGRNRRNRVVRKLAFWGRALYRSYENVSYDFHRNGEQRVLDVLSGDPTVKTLLDVGANAGEWSAMAAQRLPGAQIHAFEIVPSTAAIFEANNRHLANVRLNALGLSDREGEDQVFFAEGQSTIATCVPDFADDFHHIETKAISVRTATGDGYCAAYGIERVDFLKVDVEGYEDKVLRGFSGLLKARAIRAIQFEYGYVNIASRFLLKDFYDLLTQHGFVVGKIYPTYVDFRPYRHSHEDFLGPNFLAVLATERELLQKLGS